MLSPSAWAVIVLFLLSGCTSAQEAQSPMKASVPVQRVFGPEHPGGRYKHAPSITQLSNGDLYLVFYAGSDEYAEDTAIYGARLPKGSSAVDDSLCPLPMRRTVLKATPSSGRHLTAKCGCSTWCATDQRGANPSFRRRFPTTARRTWSDPMVVSLTQGMMVRNHPLTLPNGDILLPAYHEVGDDPESVSAETCSLFFIYDAKNHTWTETNRIRSRLGNLQPAVVAMTDKHLICYCRAGGSYEDLPDRRIVWAESHDGGRTWSEGRDTEFSPNCGGGRLIRLRNGHLLLLIFNDSTVPLPNALRSPRDFHRWRQDLPLPQEPFRRGGRLRLSERGAG
jgi:hypothetical protein